MFVRSLFRYSPSLHFAFTAYIYLRASVLVDANHCKPCHYKYMQSFARISASALMFAIIIMIQHTTQSTMMRTQRRSCSCPVRMNVSKAANEATTSTNHRRVRYGEVWSVDCGHLSELGPGASRIAATATSGQCIKGDDKLRPRTSRWCR